MRQMYQVLIMLMLSGVEIAISAASIDHILHFSTDSLIFKQSGEYDVVYLPNACGSSEPGKPDLPRILTYALIPYDAEVEFAEIVDQEEVELAGTYTIFPVQVPNPLSRPDLASATAPDSRIYSLETLYPSKMTEVSTVGNLNGFRIAGVMLSPLRYLPSEKKLTLLTRGTLRLHLKSVQRPVPVISRRQYDETVPVVKKLVCNSKDLKTNAPAVRSDALTDVNYAVITDDTFKDSFDAFKSWKTRKGLITEVFTTSWIYGNYQGYDNPEKIRNFLKEYHAQKGLIYVLLAGDYDKVPQRLVSSTLNPGDVASDLYYADLDGTWDTNNNNKYGEPRFDTVDGYCDIFPGRVPADNAAQIGFFIHKDTVMEKKPALSALKKVLFPSNHLWDEKHGKIINNVIADTTGPRWLDIKLEDPVRTAVRDSINNGIYISHISSHGNPSSFLSKDSTMMLTKEDAQVMTATDAMFPILFSIACNVGQFDNPSYDCIAEELVLRQKGGCVATMLNSRYGYGAISAAHFNSSEVLSFQIASFLFNNDTLTLGKVLAAAKHTFRNQAWERIGLVASTHNVVNGLTLLGDPDLPIFRNEPTVLSANYEKVIKSGQQTFPVTVTSGSPLPGALVCLYKQGEVHQTGFTDASGKAQLSINPTNSGIMHVTVTAKDRLPFEGVSNVGTTAIVNRLDATYGSPELLSIFSERSGMVTIRYRTVQSSRVSAMVHDSRGAVIKRTFTTVPTPGVHTLKVDGCSAGVFFVKIRIDGYTSGEKVVVVK